MAVISKTDRHGVDIIIENLQQALYPRLLAYWDVASVYTSYPRANKNYKDDNIIPEISLDEKDYKETLMDDKISVNSFWLVENTRPYSTIDNRFTHNISVIFQADLVALYGQSNRADEEFNINILNELRRPNPYMFESDITMIEGVDSVYSDLTISGDMKEHINLHDIGKLHVVRFDFEVKYNSSCGIPNMPPVCPVIAETFNSVSITSPLSFKNIVVQTDDAIPVQTGTILVDTAESLVIQVSVGGDPAANQVNGASKTDIPSGGSKNFVIQDQDSNPVTVTEVSDSATEFVGSVVIPVGVGDIYYNMPQPTWGVVYNTWDEGDHNNKGTYDNTIPANGRVQMLQSGEWYKVQFDKETRGHLYRFLGLNGGYYNDDDGLYYDASHVVSTRAAVIDDDDYIFDRLTGLGWRTRRTGAMTYTSLIAFAEAATYNSFTDWHVPFTLQYESILNRTLLNPFFVSPIFTIQLNLKTVTPDPNFPTLRGGLYIANGSYDQDRTYTTTDVSTMCRDARGQF